MKVSSSKSPADLIFRLLAESPRMPTHLLSTRDLNRDLLLYYFKLARAFECSEPASYSNLLVGRVAAVLFFQQSLRTRLSFETAIQRLGGRVVGFADARSTRCVGFYQETPEDVVRFVGQWTDLVVIRHFETGIVSRLGQISPVPIFNGGDGYGEHPSQALGDLYHLYKHFNGLDGIRMGIVGSLNTRGLRSLVIGLSNFETEIVVLPPPNENIPHDVVDLLKQRNITLRIVSDIHQLLTGVDAVITVGIVQGDFEKPVSQEKKAIATPESHRITLEALQSTGRDVVVMHPAPITDEIDRVIDSTSYAHYFAQARDGMWMRMAVISSLLKTDVSVLAKGDEDFAGNLTNLLQI